MVTLLDHYTAVGLVRRGRWSHLEVTINHKAIVHMFQTQDDLCCIETHLCLREDPMLGEVIM